VSVVEPNDHREETESDVSESDDDDDDAESSSSLASVSGRGESTLPDSSYELQMIPDTISRLHRLAVAIRKPAIATQNSKAAKYQEFDEDNNDVFEIFEKDVAMFLAKFHFPHAGETLHNRLSRTMAFRRRRFHYRKRHQIKLSGPRYIVPKRKYLSAGPPSQTTTSRALGIAFPKELNAAAKEMTTNHAASICMSDTTASKFTESKFKPDAPSTKASSAVSGTGSQKHRLEIPPAPKVPEGASEFFCPHCCLVLPAIEAKEKRWRYFTPLSSSKRTY
jgi:hypothetical protein